MKFDGTDESHNKIRGLVVEGQRLYKKKQMAELGRADERSNMF